MIKKLRCGVFFLGIMILLQGCVGLDPIYPDQDGPWSVHPDCHLECVTIDTGLSEIVSATGLNKIGVEACFSSNTDIYLPTEYCEKSLNKYCERAALKLSQENPLYSRCTVAQTSQCVGLGFGHFTECKTIVWIATE
jgi:hypothetical protein